MIHMRNKATGEIRDVEPDSQEFYDLQKEVVSSGLPMWEQTHYPHAQAIRDRAAYGELLEEDLGMEDQENLRFAALELDAEGVAPESNPHLQLTPGEIEQGLTPQQKLEDLRAMRNQDLASKRHGIFNEAADRIADERKERPSAGEGGALSARAGGSDDRRNAPAPGDNAGAAGAADGDLTEQGSDDDLAGTEADPQGASPYAGGGDQ